MESLIGLAVLVAVAYYFSKRYKAEKKGTTGGGNGRPNHDGGDLQ